MIMQGDNSLVEYLQKIVGSTLIGRYEKAFYILYGEKGNNGKTTFIESIADVLGDYSKAADISTFIVKNNKSISSDRARLAGARLVYTSENEEGDKLAVALIKTMTGGATQTVRFLFQNEFTFMPQFKTFLDTNHKPKAPSDDNALWNRIRLLPFNYEIPEDKIIPDFKENVLAKEYSGILNWMIAGALKYNEEGLKMPDKVKSATNEYRNAMDIISDFISEKCNFNKNKYEPKGNIYDAYLKWHKDRKNDGYPIKKITFLKRLLEKYSILESDVQENIRVIKGIQLNKSLF